PAEEIAAGRTDLAPPAAVLDYRLVAVQAERGDRRAGAVGRLWLPGYPGRVPVLNTAPVGSLTWEGRHGDAAGGPRGGGGDRRPARAHVGAQRHRHADRDPLGQQPADTLGGPGGRRGLPAGGEAVRR